MSLKGLLLGAGASFELGMPLVTHLTRELKEWLTPEKLRNLNRSWKGNEGGYSDTVIEDLASILTLDGQHYESILGYLETQFRRNSPLAQEYHRLYSWMVELVYYILYFRHIKNAVYIQNNLSFFEGLSSLAEKNLPLWIFSLNHDLLIECAAAKFNIPLNSGFTNKKISLPRRKKTGEKIGELTAEIISEEQLEKGSMPFLKPGFLGINLLKIHGALDVFTFRDGKDLLKIIPVESSIQGVIEALRIANEELLFLHPSQPDCPIKTSNEVTYADDYGEMQFLRRSLLGGAFKFNNKHHQVLPHNLLKHFESNIKYVSGLVSIGYGFGDNHINMIVREWLEFSSQRHLEIVSPGIKDIPGFLLHLAPQVILADSSATDYFDRAGNVTRSQRDISLKKFAAWSRDHGKDSTQFQKFLKNHQEGRMHNLIQELKNLPWKDGDVDLNSLGISASELAQRVIGKPITAEEIIEKFLSNQQ